MIVHLDIHTGLGGFGQLQLLVNDPPGTPEARWLTQCFGAAVTLADQRRTYRAHGTMTDDLRARLAPCVYHGITAEFGTFSGLRVLGALRAENRAHFHGMPEDPMRSRPKQQLLETFAPASAHWRRRVVDSGTHLIDQSIDAVTRWSV